MNTKLEIVHAEIMACTKCELHRNRTMAVPGEGPDNARVMLVGEGPGENEDREGRPFVGAAGKLLTELLESIGMKRSEVFVTNIVKCRPPQNRPPRQGEIEACNPYLETQIRLIDPKIVCPLGSPALRTVLGSEYSVSQVHGKPFRKDGRVILPLYHPAAALYDASLREPMFRDINVLKELLYARIGEENIVRTGSDKNRKVEPLHTWL